MYFLMVWVCHTIVLPHIVSEYIHQGIITSLSINSHLPYLNARAVHIYTLNTCVRKAWKGKNRG
eukprot:COSAG01_NODE_64715_length_275_cov_1.295455_1_plen_63_part_01